MMRDNRGRVGDVARSLGGIPVTPPVDPELYQTIRRGIKGVSKNRRTDHNRVRGGGAGDRSPISSRLRESTAVR